jgi:hypothetical protein
MSKAIFQVMGGLALLSAAALLVGGFFTMLHYPSRSLWNIAPSCAVVTGLVVSGVGLLYLRKWAAMIFSALALCVATLEIRCALHPTPGDANWLGLIFGALFAIPSVLTVFNWGTLPWGRHYLTTVNTRK